MLIKIFNSYLITTEKYVAGVCTKKYWQLKLAVFCTILTILFGAPDVWSYYDVVFPKEPSSLSKVINAQIDHPLTPIPNLNPESHEAKRTFRLTMPLIAKLLPFDSNSWHKRILFLIGLQYLIGFFFFLTLIKIFSQIFSENLPTFLSTLSFAFIFPGKAFFIDLSGCFDGMAFFFLALTFLSKNRFIILISLLAAFWTDERAMVASVFSYIWLKMIESNNKISLKTFLIPSRISIMVPIAIIITLAIRYYLSEQFNLVLPHSSQELRGGHSLIDYFTVNSAVRIPIGIMSPIKFYWVVIGLSAIILWQKKSYFFLNIIFCCLLVFLTICFSVNDFTRSMAYVFPLIFIGLKIIAENNEMKFVRNLTFITLLFCIIMPTFIVFTKIYWKAGLFQLLNIIN